MLDRIRWQDQAEAFGQHPNADISYMITDSEITLESCLSLQPKTGGGDSSSKKTEALVNTIIDDMLQQVPGPYNHEKLMKDKVGLQLQTFFIFLRSKLC